MSKEESVKKAAELLRQGATMLDIACPICYMPLFKLKNGDVVCPTHGKIYIVKNEEEEKQITTSLVLDNLEKVLVKGLENISNKLKENPMDEDSVTQIIRYLEALERVRRIKNLDKNK
ncbi:hypothetical protein DDW09_00135 [Sulfolobus sp. SCGC AB-777_L09]|nr:hypothetical protein DDW09_00135 [Sulfolobus sp. SCGC AB-777_L09]